MSNTKKNSNRVGKYRFPPRNRTIERSKVLDDLVGMLDGMRLGELQVVAGDSDTTLATLYLWIAGGVKSPQISTIVRVADALGYEVALVPKKTRGRK